MSQHGQWIYGLLAGIVFGETGLVILPFLPGDTLLFAAGAYVALGMLNGWLLFAILFTAAVAGNTVNYYIARALEKRYGALIFSGKLKWLDHDALTRTHAFYLKHGGKTLVLARFIPIVRTFAPFVAGVAGMKIAAFQLYNVLGAAIWVGSLTLAGMLFGNLPWVKQHLNIIILMGVAAAVLPLVFAALWKLLGKKR